MAAHYGTAILPARRAKPRDKAKVEAGVLIVERWILARLRNRRFFSLAELNVTIAEELERLNRAKGDAPPRRYPAAAVRPGGPAGAQRPAGGSLRLCRMAALPSRSRLPRPDRRPRL